MKKIYKLKNIKIFLILIFGCIALNNNYFILSSYANETGAPSKHINNKNKKVNTINKRKIKKPYKKISYAFFKGSPQYPRQIKLICSEMEKDGRAEKFAEIVGTKTDKDPYCIACKELFENFKDECGKKFAMEKKLKEKALKEKQQKEKKSKNNVKKDIKIKKNYPQREMSLALIDLVDVFFTELAQDEKLNKEATKAVIVLLYLLKNYEPMTVGEKEYFDTLYIYIKQPFKELIEQAPNNKKLHEKEEKQLLHNLFGR